MGIRYLKVFYVNLMQKLGKLELWARLQQPCIMALGGASGWYLHLTLNRPINFCLVGDLHGHET